MNSENFDFSVIILAAGLGKRMAKQMEGTNLPKSLTVTCQERSFIQHQLELLAPLNPKQIIIVTGHKKELVESHIEELKLNSSKLGSKITPFPKIIFAHQPEQLGTGDAAKCGINGLIASKSFLPDENSLILYGDVPLITKATLESLMKKHASSNSELTLLTLITDQQTTYGRIIRDTKSSSVLRITELKDCSADEALIKELNPGIYIGKNSFLLEALNSLNNNNAQKEYYLTDIVEIAVDRKKTVETASTTDAIEVQGVNTKLELSLVNTELYKRKVAVLIEDGVTFVSPETVFIKGETKIGAGTTVGPNVQFVGNNQIGENVTIEGTAFLKDVTIAANATIKLGVRAERALIGEGASVGPFAHLRLGTELAAEAKIGNFVETKNAKIGARTAASHLTYLGDCVVGKEYERSFLCI